MNTLEKPVYAMLRGSEQIIRVNLIQHVWFQTLGYLLHPLISQDVTDIADVATATGLWLCELDAQHRQLRQSGLLANVQDYQKLDGFDISAQSFLPDDQRLSNVVLQVQDATKDVPTQLQGRYDVVHIRCIQPGVYDGDPSSIIKHCHGLLRPGGYLQWEEFDTLDYKMINKNDGENLGPSHLQQVADKFKEGNPKEWVAQLPASLQNHGFSIKAADRMREPAWHRTTMTHLVCGVVDEISRARIDKVGPPGAGEKLRAVIRAAIEENLSSGSYISSLFQVVVAQKTM